MSAIVLLPIIFWVFILVLVSAVSKSSGSYRRTNRGSARGGYGQSSMPSRNFSKPRTTIKMSSDRPQMQTGLFDMKLGKAESKRRKSTTDMDMSDVAGRLKDFVTGYDKTYADTKLERKRAAHMQYSHTYDGHEPWDDCLPKEKDPWDKDFYA